MLNLNEVTTQDECIAIRYVDWIDFEPYAIERMRLAGLHITKGLIANGKIQRVHTDSNEKEYDKPGWYIAFSDCIPVVVFQNYKTEEKIKITGRDAEIAQNAPVRFAPKSYLDDKRTSEEEKKEAEAKQCLILQKQNEYRKTFYSIQSEDVSKHPYVIAKGLSNLISPFDEIKCSNGKFYIALRSKYSNDIISYQTVSRLQDGQFLKLNAKDVPFKGCFHIIPPSDNNYNVIYLCEGWATGCSIFAATGKAVVCCGNAGNMPIVAQDLRSSLEDAEIIICADNDQFTTVPNMYGGKKPYNTGLLAAQKAAEIVKAKVVYPKFKNPEMASFVPTDFNDLMILEGLEEVRRQILNLQDSFPDITFWGIDNYLGKAPVQEWLVNKTIPMAAPSLLVARGGTGKGMLTLDLALQVASSNTVYKEYMADYDQACEKNNKSNLWLGSLVSSHGSAVILTAEDSKADIHRRLEQLDPTGERREQAKGRLFIVPLPDSSGPISLVRTKGYGQGFELSPEYSSLLGQLKKIPDLKLINIDPLASFVACDINADPQAGQYVNGALAKFAQETGAAVIVTHHMGKSNNNGKNKEDLTAQDARDSIRGTSALVDGVRLAIAIWPMGSENSINEVKERIKNDTENEEFIQGLKKDDFFYAAVVKSNCPAETATRKLVRNHNGLLTAVSIGDSSVHSIMTLKDMVVEQVRLAAEQGHPYNRTGTNGVFNRIDEFPSSLYGCSRNKIERLIDELLKEKAIVQCTYKKGQGRLLDVPNGDFAKGIGEIKSGALNESIVDKVVNL